MTSVNVTELNNGFLFECSGHAGAGEKGSDLVCAGVSALCIALIRRLEDMERERIIKMESFALSDGELSVEVSWEDRVCAFAACGVLRTVTAGLERLSEMYPENVYCNF